MQFAELEICIVTEELWREVIGLPVRRRTGVTLPPETVLTGIVRIEGGWTGQVVVECSERLAFAAAGKMFSIPAARVSRAEAVDAIGELANMTAGNLKTVLPGSSRLSLPRVRGGAPMNLDDVLSRISFEIDGAPR